MSVSAQVVKTIIIKTGTTGIVAEDRRGKVCKNSLISESIKQTVRNHINSFQTVESHYCRQKTSRQYLPATLNVCKMYSLYLEYCQDNNIQTPASEAMYRLILSTEFNLSFFQLMRYDNSSSNEKLVLEEEYHAHIRNKNLARELKQQDKQKAAENKNEMCCAVFDLQKVLPVPKSNVGVSFYKLKLSAYNFSVYDLATKDCICYMCHEVIAKRSSSEIGSCLFLYIKEKVEIGIRTFLFYSDNCSGQNMNKFLYSMYNYLCQKYNVTIRHTYLEKGHTVKETLYIVS